MENNRILPVGLKGKEVDSRMRELMGISNINENTVIPTPNNRNVSVQLTKIGPDGKAYAIIRENHNHYIKVADKTSGLVVEDFKYIGGLMNKKDQTYPSYARAIKFLNLRFTSIAESRNIELDINTFVDDNLLGEGFGFSGAGNLEGQTPLWEEEIEETEVVEGADNAEAEDLLTSDEATDEELSEAEKAIDAMLSEEDEECEPEMAVENMRRDGLNPTTPDGESLPPEPEDAPDPIVENRLSISKLLENMDLTIDSLVDGSLKKKVYTLK